MNKNKTAIVFPGQGTQQPGMGRDFYDNIPVSRDTFEEASQALGWDVANINSSEQVCYKRPGRQHGYRGNPP